MSATGREPTWPVEARSVTARVPMAILMAGEARNVSAVEVLRALSLDSDTLGEEGARVSVQDEQAVWRECGERIGAPLRGFEVLHGVPLGFFGLPEMLFATAATFGDAVQVAIDFMPLIREGLSLHAVEHGDVLELSYSFDEPLQLLESGSIEFFLSSVLTLGAACLGHPPDVRRIYLPPKTLAEPGAREALVEAYGTKNVLCDAVRPQIVIPRSVLNLQQRTSAPRLHSILRAHATEVLAEQCGEAQFLLRLRHMMLLDLERGELSLASVSHRLHLSKRSLQRRIAERGTTFAEQRDELRQTLAKQYLRDEQLQLAEVSYRLGYGSPQAFHRAFQGWFGCSPNTWRRRQRGGLDDAPYEG